MRMPTLLVASALLTTMSAGCEPSEGNSERPVHCEVIVDAPDEAEKSGKMQARVRFSCDKPGAESLTLKLKLEKKSGEEWHTVSSATHTVKGMDTHASGFDRQSRQLEVDCALGSFRAVVDWSRVSRKDTEGDNLVSGVKRDPCKT